MGQAVKAVERAGMPNGTFTVSNTGLLRTIPQSQHVTHGPNRETKSNSRETHHLWKCNMNRREKIEAMLEDDPTDMFLRYSLAMELRTEGDHTRSLAQLDELMKEEPACVPAFFMAGQQLVDLDRIDAARTALRNGIEEARKQGDAHAAAEMSDFLTSLGDLGEL